VVHGICVMCVICLEGLGCARVDRHLGELSEWMADLVLG
jgi:hypothetical protein